MMAINCFSTTVVYMPTSGNTPNYTRNISRLGFKLKNPVKADNVEYAYEITYLDRYEEDNGAAEIRMQYYMADGNDADEIYDSASIGFNLDNDNAWKTVKGTFKAFTQLQGIPLEGAGVMSVPMKLWWHFGTPADSLMTGKKTEIRQV